MKNIGSFKSYYAKWRLYLLFGWIEESAIGGLEFRFSDIRVAVSTLREGSVHLTSTESKGINSIWVLEEMGIAWILLHVFPSGMRPSAWYQLEILFWNSNLSFLCKAVVCFATRAHWSASGLVATTIVEHVVPWFFGVLHCCLQIYKLINYT